MDSTGRVIRVGSLNVWGMFASWPDRLAVLSQHEALQNLDVLLAQEVCVGPGIDQAEELSQALGLPHYVFHSDKEVHGLQEGVAVFSREPLSTVGRTNLGQGRVLIEADCFGNVTFASAHLSFEGRERSEQVKALLKRVTLKRAILGADFNGELSTFEEALDKYWSEVAEDEPTWPVCGEDFFRSAWEMQTGTVVDFDIHPRRVDYILTRGVTSLASATVPLEINGVYGTDHALTVSEILI